MIMFLNPLNSFAEPERKRWDVRHISLFWCQNNIRMGHTCWRAIIVNSYTLLRMLSQRCCYSEARYVHLPFCLGFWAVNWKLSNSAFGISDAWQGWLMRHFLVECKTYRGLLLLQWKKSVSSLKSSWHDTGYSLVEFILDPCCCALKAFLVFKKSSNLVLKSNWWNASAGSAVWMYVQKVLYA